MTDSINADDDKAWRALRALERISSQEIHGLEDAANAIKVELNIKVQRNIASLPKQITAKCKMGSKRQAGKNEFCKKVDKFANEILIKGNYCIYSLTYNFFMEKTLAIPKPQIDKNAQYLMTTLLMISIPLRLFRDIENLIILDEAHRYGFG